MLSKLMEQMETILHPTSLNNSDHQIIQMNKVFNLALSNANWLLQQIKDFYCQQQHRCNAHFRNLFCEQKSL